MVCCDFSDLLLAYVSGRFVGGTEEQRKSGLEMR